jgi:hypothetical protein
MRRHKIAVILASVLMLASASSFAADSASTGSSTSLTQKGKDLFLPEFGKADRDKDGTLDRAEATAYPMLPHTSTQSIPTRTVR